jgi:hypothetical protein
LPFENRILVDPVSDTETSAVGEFAPPTEIDACESFKPILAQFPPTEPCRFHARSQASRHFLRAPIHFVVTNGDLQFGPKSAGKTNDYFHR